MLRWMMIDLLYFTKEFHDDLEPFTANELFMDFGVQSTNGTDQIDAVRDHRDRIQMVSFQEVLCQWDQWRCPSGKIL